MRRYLFNVLLVKHKDGEILMDKKIVSDCSEHAVVKVDLQKVCTDNKCELEETETIIVRLGELREVKEVKMDDIK